VKYEESVREFHLNQQKAYRDFLEHQIGNGHRRGKSLGGALFEQEQVYVPPQQIGNQKIINRNPSLGPSFIHHNPILNPIPDYRHNKYLYPDQIGRIQKAGSNIIGH
jgi:hypothetical protein